MLYILPSCILACIACFILGFYIRGLNDRLKKLGKQLDDKLHEEHPAKRDIISEIPKSDILDPLDEVAEARYQHELMMKKLNPE